jgi:hypothetical protein
MVYALSIKKTTKGRFAVPADWKIIIAYVF